MGRVKALVMEVIVREMETGLKKMTQIKRLSMTKISGWGTQGMTVKQTPKTSRTARTTRSSTWTMGNLCENAREASRFFRIVNDSGKPVTIECHSQDKSQYRHYHIFKDN